MKQIFKFLGIALMAVCMGVSFASCDDDENTNTNNNQKPPENQNTIDFKKFNLMENSLFYLTNCYFPEFTSENGQWIQGGTQDGTLYCGFHGNEQDAENNYQGWLFEILINSRSEIGFDINVDEYIIATQKLVLSTDEDIYTGNIEFSQDKDKVYMSWMGESHRGGTGAEFDGWKLKSTIH